MKTLLTESPEEAAGFIRRGLLAAFPTETVYGLGADVFDEDALSRIFIAKKRPADNPLIAHIGSIRQISRLASEVGAHAERLIEAFFPGPLTVVLKRSPNVPLTATAGLDSIGIRMPRHELARAFLRACDTPVAAPSANLSGRPSPTSWQAVLEDLDGRIDCILKGSVTEIGLESTVVDCTGERPRVLRPGAVSLEQLRSVIPETDVYLTSSGGPLPSPGMRHKHYAPSGKVAIGHPPAAVPDPERTAFIGTGRPATQLGHVRIVADDDDYARSLFAFLRECDRLGIALIYCEPVPETGIGAALMDRLRRAADGQRSRT